MMNIEHFEGTCIMLGEVYGNESQDNILISNLDDANKKDLNSVTDVYMQLKCCRLTDCR